MDKQLICEIVRTIIKTENSLRQEDFQNIEEEVQDINNHLEFIENRLTELTEVLGQLKYYLEYSQIDETISDELIQF